MRRARRNAELPGERLDRLLNAGRDEMNIDAGIEKDRGFAIYRPWIQTWQLNAEEINTVQGEVEQRGLGWMIWSANTLYDNSFLPAG